MLWARVVSIRRYIHRVKHINYAVIVAFFLCCFIFSGCGSSGNSDAAGSDDSSDITTLGSPAEIGLASEDDVHFTFSYHNEIFQAVFITDTWKIIDSYKITNSADLVIICRALTEKHPVPTSDRSGERTPEDLAYEWEQHNLAYSLLPEGAKWKDNAKDVDLNPEDQGKNIVNYVIERTTP